MLLRRILPFLESLFLCLGLLSASANCYNPDLYIHCFNSGSVFLPYSGVYANTTCGGTAFTAYNVNPGSYGVAFIPAGSFTLPQALTPYGYDSNFGCNNAGTFTVDTNYCGLNGTVFNVYCFGSSGGTNGTPPRTCTFTVANNSGVPANYQLYLNGAAVGGTYGQAFISLNPGQIGTLSANGGTTPCNLYTIAQMTGATPSIASLGPGSNALFAATGTISTLMPSGSYGVTDTGVNSPATSQYTSATTSIYSNPASWGSNQPISFSTNAVAGDTINTLQTGFSAVKQAVDNADANIVGAVNGMASKLGSGSSNAVNVSITNSVVVTNVPDYYSSNLLAMGTNYLFDTNGAHSAVYAQGVIGTNAANGFASTVGSGSNALVTAFSGGPGAGGEGTGSKVINVSGASFAGRTLPDVSLTLDLDNPAFAVLDLVKKIWADLTYLSLFLFSSTLMFKQIGGFIKQRQVTTTGQTVAGFNVSLASIIVVASIIVGLLTTLTASLEASVITGGSGASMASLASDISSFASGDASFAWRVATKVCPVAVIFSCGATGFLFWYAAETIGGWFCIVLLLLPGV